MNKPAGCSSKMSEITVNYVFWSLLTLNKNKRTRLKYYSVVQGYVYCDQLKVNEIKTNQIEYIMRSRNSSGHLSFLLRFTFEANNFSEW